MRADVYCSLDARFNDASASSVGFCQLIATSPYHVSTADGLGLERRAAPIREYQTTLARLWLDRELPAEFNRVRTWSAPVPAIRREGLEPEDLLPRFVRTDESRQGKIYELQCPGSWWGTREVLAEVLGGFGPTLADRVASDLLHLVPEGPAIQHLFESSSSPMENQYFAQRIRRSSVGAIRYWGVDAGLGKDEVNLVRSHSYTALVAEDLFRLRLAAFLEGRMRFDHPPIPIFDQKLAMYLPFSPATTSWFSDDVRDLFPYTALIERDVVRIETDEVVPIRQLRTSPDLRDAYVLKYAGADTTRNFGSRGVYVPGQLTDDDLDALLASIEREYDEGEHWLLQAFERSSEPIEYLGEDGTVKDDDLSTKFCSFYGPHGLHGVLLLATPSSHVRWTPSTVVAPVELSGSEVSI